MLAKQSYIEDILHRNECVKDSLQQISDSIELAKEMRARAEAEILEKKNSMIGKCAMTSESV